MLVKKSHHFTLNKELNRNSLLMNIQKNLLKTLIYKIRSLSSIYRCSYQQLQVDLYFLLQIIYEMVSVDDENLITGFYIVMMESAAEVCIDLNNSKLDPNIIETISSIKRAKMKI